MNTLIYQRSELLWGETLKRDKIEVTLLILISLMEMLKMVTKGCSPSPLPTISLPPMTFAFRCSMPYAWKANTYFTCQNKR